jgi:type II secretory pathway pseudopilin PulG
MAQSDEAHSISMEGVKEAGFSLIESLIVVSIIIALTAISFFTLAPHKRAYSTEDAANQVVNFMREAHQLALTHRHSFRLVINLNTRTISIIDEETVVNGGNNEGDAISGDDRLVRDKKLVDQVSMLEPAIDGTPIPLPPAPYNYPAATSADFVWTCHFQSDGSVRGGGAPVSATFFFSPQDMSSKDASLIRAVTLFGPSGSIKYWKYDGAKFISEVR